MSPKCKGLSLVSGGLDSRLAVCVCRDAGAYMEGVCFTSVFFGAPVGRAVPCPPPAAAEAAEQLKIKLHVIDFTDDEIALIKNPPHGFGGAMNPCIDCHATMIKRAGELMTKLGFDFVSTGEVMGQRPMSQNKQSLGIVERSSGLGGRLLRPLSAKLMDPTIPETEGLLDRDKLLDIQGRGRERQIELAAHYGLTDYPSPAGGCKLTEDAFGRKLRDLMDHEGLDNRELVDLIVVGRRFRFPDGTSVMLGRDARENEILESHAHLGTIVKDDSLPGPTALVIGSADAKPLVAAYSRGTTAADRTPFKPYQIM